VRSHAANKYRMHDQHNYFIKTAKIYATHKSRKTGHYKEHRSYSICSSHRKFAEELGMSVSIVNKIM